MSDISIHAGINVSKGGAEVNKNEVISVGMSGSFIDSGVLSAGTTEETIPVQDTTTYGYVLLKNLDSDSNVVAGTSSGSLGIKMKPGEVALFRCASDAVYVKGVSSNCNVEYTILED